MDANLTVCYVNRKIIDDIILPLSLSPITCPMKWSIEYMKKKKESPIELT